MDGSLLPEMAVPPPGPQSRQWLTRLAQVEAPSLVLPGGVVWAEAVGSNVVDVDGNRYIDLSAAFGVAGIGHRNPRVLAAIQAQSERLLHGMGDVYANMARIEVLELIQRMAPLADGRGFLAGGGAEAVEIALKTATLATGKPGVLAWTGGYHGLTLGALAPTSRAAFRDPFARHLSPLVVRAPYPYPLRATGDCAAEALERAEALLKAAHPAPIGAVIVEPIQGREGEIVPPAGWLRDLRTLCDTYGALLIADEIFTGWGRTGRWWGVDHDGVQPDLICMGKGMTGGMPLAACVGRAEVMQAWQVEGEPLHTATFMGHPLACIAAQAAIQELQEKRLPERAAALGEQIMSRLHALAARTPLIGEVRGRGLMIGIELVDSSGPASAATLQIAQQLQERGILILAGGMDGNVLSITPPFVITESQIDYALTQLEDVITHFA